MFRTVLQIANRYSGQTDVGEKITTEIGQAKVLTLNVRKDSGHPDAWRDYQQAFAEVGAIHSTQVTSGRIVVTPIAHSLLDGDLDYPQFLTVQALGYQYPNGAKRVLPARVRASIEGTSFEKARTLIDIQLTAGIRLKPFLLCLQVMRELLRIGETPYLSRDEMQRFLVFSISNDNPQDIAHAVGDFRNGRLQAPPPSGDTRNFNDIIAFLGRCSIFQQVQATSPSLTLQETSSEFLAFVDRVIDLERKESSFFNFGNGSVEQAEQWFEFYGDLRRAERLFDPLSISRDVGLSDALDDITAGRLATTPPLTDYELRGERKGPSSALRPRRAPEETAQLREKARKNHQNLVDLVGELVKTLGATPKHSLTVDLFAEVGGKKFYFEMKTANRVNVLGQVRKGISQLYEYSYQYEKGGRGDNLVLCLVLNMKPSTPNWLIDYIVRDRGIALCWKRNGGFDCPPECKDALGQFFSVRSS